MKQSLFSFAVIICLLLWSTISSAQMMNLTVEDYNKCVNNCKSLENSGDRAICIEGCRYVSSSFTRVSLKTLEQAPNFINAINSKPLKEGGNVFFTDAKSGMQYEAVVSNGQLIDYLVKNKAGTIVPSRLVTVEKDRKRCFIYVNGKLVEVRCPDVIIIVHEPITQ
jgi:hypothetical protein